MSKNHVQQSTAAPRRGSGKKRRHASGLTRWTVAMMGLVGLAVAAVGFVVLKPLFAPHYWTADDLGPIQTNSGSPASPAPEGMVWVPGGTFWMGAEEFADARPLHKVYVDGFWMDKTEVTNAQFAKFVQATGYVTVVEHMPNARKFPGFRAEIFGFQPEYLSCLGTDPGFGLTGLSWGGLCQTQSGLKPFSLVFRMPNRPVDLKRTPPSLWWRAVPGACWKQPEGPGSNVKDRDNHPVVHICYEDAVAYCKWANKRLPTEAEWEFAARGGLDRKPYAWGDELTSKGQLMANTWQGKFPHYNTREDGYAGTAPVGSFPPNGFGLSDMAGNVWEWCSDWYQPKYLGDRSARNPQGPSESNDPSEPGVPKRVQRGGSFLCCDNYCVRFKMGGRGKGDLESTGNHIGFRCVKAAN